MYQLKVIEIYALGKQFIWILAMKYLLTVYVNIYSIKIDNRIALVILAKQTFICI